VALHSVLASMLEADRKSGRPLLSDGSPDDARALIAKSCAALGPGPDVGRVTELAIPTRSGSVPGRLFRPLASEHGLIVYLHGGGWLAGTLDGSDALARTLVSRSGCALVLVDYRLAPEHPFPSGLEDVEDAIRWADTYRRSLTGGDISLILAGDSAGANLATVAAASLKHEIDVAMQLLFYPVTDTDTDRASYRIHGEGLRFTRNDMIWFLGHYALKDCWTDPRIAPLRSNNLAGSPPAWIATAEYDVLLDEGEDYAKRLSAFGVPVELRRYLGVTHGFARMMNILDVADQALHDAAAVISKSCLARPSNVDASVHKP
jgi:acetyl esterase